MIELLLEQSRMTLRCAVSAFARCSVKKANLGVLLLATFVISNVATGTDFDSLTPNQRLYVQALQAEKGTLARPYGGDDASWEYSGLRRRKYVNSIQDFFDHMASHIERVESLGLTLKELRPRLFYDVDPYLLKILLSIHDFEKLRVDPVTGRREVLEELFKTYGVDFDTLPPDEKAQQIALRNRLNKGDKGHARQFFELFNDGNRFIDKKGNYTRRALKYLLIESVADKVDRGMSPVSAEEFNREKMVLASKSKYITDRTERKLAKLLEQISPGSSKSRYTLATLGHTYEDYQKRMNRRYRFIFEGDGREHKISFDCVKNHINLRFAAPANDIFPTHMAQRFRQSRR
jgi:hypothetical protein